MHLEPGKPGLHQKSGEVKGGDTCLVGPEILHSSLWASSQEGHGHFRVKRAQKRATKMVRAMKHLSYEERLRGVVFFRQEERRCQRDLGAAFQYTKSIYKKAVERLFYRGLSVRGQGPMSLN